MGWPKCNTTLEDEMIAETSLFEGHDFTFHQLGLWISAACGIVAIAISFFLMSMHLTHYSKPTEQRHIVRILFMVPVYAAVSFLSFVYYYHSVYFDVLRDCYEAFAIASFFSLMCAYLADDLHHQKEYFRTIKPKRWILPISWFQKCCGGDRGIWRTPRSGLTWFNVIWVAVFQYCFIRVFMTIVAVVTQYFGLYCLESLNPAFSHVWVMVIEAVAVSIAMYCLIQFYIQVKGDIQQHQPLLKILAIKLVIFLSFWQTLLISFLTSSGVMSASDRIQTPDIKVGIPAMLLCIEMALFAILHIWSFSWKPYVIGSKRYLAVNVGKAPQDPHYQGGFLGLKAVLNCFNPWDLIKAVGRSAKWLFQGRKHRMEDVSYATALNGNLNQVQKMNDVSPPDEYHGAGTRPEYEEGQKLLSTAQSMPVYQPPSPNEQYMAASSWAKVDRNEYLQSKQQQQPAIESTVPTPSGNQSQTQRFHGEPRSELQNQNVPEFHVRPPSQRQNFSRPGHYDTTQQETGITAAVQTQPQRFVNRADLQAGSNSAPYPMSRQEAASQPSNGPSSASNRISMPYYPGSSNGERNLAGWRS